MAAEVNVRDKVLHLLTHAHILKLNILCIAKYGCTLTYVYIHTYIRLSWVLPHFSWLSSIVTVVVSILDVVLQHLKADYGILTLYCSSSSFRHFLRMCTVGVPVPLRNSLSHISSNIVHKHIHTYHMEKNECRFAPVEVSIVARLSGSSCARPLWCPTFCRCFGSRTPESWNVLRTYMCPAVR